MQRFFRFALAGLLVGMTGLAGVMAYGGVRFALHAYSISGHDPISFELAMGWTAIATWVIGLAVLAIRALHLATLLISRGSTSGNNKGGSNGI